MLKPSERVFQFLVTLKVAQSVKAEAIILTSPNPHVELATSLAKVIEDAATEMETVDVVPVTTAG